MSAIGTSRKCRPLQRKAAYGSKADSGKRSAKGAFMSSRPNSFCSRTFYLARVVVHLTRPNCHLASGLTEHQRKTNEERKEAAPKNSPIKVMMVSGSMTMVPAVTVHILTMVTVPSAMGTAVPRSSKSLHGKQKDRCDYKNQR